MKQNGLLNDDDLPPITDTVEKFKKGSKALVSKWAKLEDQLKQALQQGNVVHGRGRRANATEKLVEFSSRAARRTTLHPGQRRRTFAAAETEVHAIYKEKRAKGLPVSAQFLRITMKRTMLKHYGEAATNLFRASG